MNHYQELSYLLRISRLFDIYRRQQMKDADLYPALFTCLSYVCRHPGRSQKEMAQNICVDKTTAAHHVARLEEKGYIVRRPSPEDRRVSLLEPTEKAMALAPMLHQTYENYYNCLLSDLSQEERAALGSLAERLFHSAQRLTREDKGKGGEKP